MPDFDIDAALRREYADKVYRSPIPNFDARREAYMKDRDAATSRPKTWPQLHAEAKQVRDTILGYNSSILDREADMRARFAARDHITAVAASQRAEVEALMQKYVTPARGFIDEYIAVRDGRPRTGPPTSTNQPSSRKDNHMTNLKITVDRQKLIDKLTAAKARVDAEYETNIAAITAALNAKDSDRWCEYLDELSQGFGEGHFEYTGRRGGITYGNWSDFDLRHIVSKDTENHPVPAAPKPNSVEHLNDRLTREREEKDYNGRQFDAAIEVLDMGVGDTLEIGVGDYNHLLQLQVQDVSL